MIIISTLILSILSTIFLIWISITLLGEDFMSFVRFALFTNHQNTSLYTFLFIVCVAIFLIMYTTINNTWLHFSF